jgi:hypothetical protein
MIFSQSSIYYPIPETGAIWREYFGGYQVTCRDYQLSITGDTLIGDHTYKKLQWFGVIHFNDPQGNCLSQFTGPYTYYSGAFRNDSLNHKVYYYPDFASDEVLLYDFNLQLNDRLPESFGYGFGSNVGPDTAYVSGVDSVLVKGEYHKRYAISLGDHYDYVHIIEGIGSTFGLLGALYPPFEFGSSLICFMMDSVSAYNEWGNECDLVTVIPENIKKTAGFSITPNPVTSGTSVIRFEFGSAVYQLVVTDPSGREILKQGHLQTGDVLNLEKLQPGIYLATIFHGKKALSAIRLVIQ